MALKNHELGAQDPLPSYEQLFLGIAKMAILRGRIQDKSGNSEMDEGDQRSFVIDRSSPLESVLASRDIDEISYTPPYPYDGAKMTDEIVHVRYAPDAEGVIATYTIFRDKNDEYQCMSESTGAFEGDDFEQDVAEPPPLDPETVFVDVDSDTEEIRQEKERIRFVLDEDSSMPPEAMFRLQEDIRLLAAALGDS